MKCIHGQGESWVAAKNSLARESNLEARLCLIERVQSVDAWLFDLDDNLAPSPAKDLIAKAVGTSVINPKYLWWLACTGIGWLAAGRKIETGRWDIYVDQFLATPQAQAEVRAYLTPEYAEASLYPGVKKLFELLPGEKYLVTRNILPVAEVYAEMLGCKGIISRANDKAQAVKEFLKMHRDIHSYGVGGDSFEDQAMIKMIRAAGKNTLGFYAMDSPNWREMDHYFDYATSKDRTALVDLLETLKNTS